MFYWIIDQILQNKPELRYIFMGFKNPIHSKLESYKNYIFNSPFLEKKLKQEALEVWDKAQTTFFSLKKFVFLYKYKKATFYDCETDLYSNKLDLLSENQKMIIYHRKKKYCFRITDIMNMWNRALSNSNELFAKPIKLKNPYTNLFFAQHELYNIYFKIRFSPFQVPFLIEQFFRLDFNLIMFSLKFAGILRNIAITNYMDQCDHEEILIDIEELCVRYYCGKSPKIFNLHHIKLLDQKKIINHMRSLLLLFYMSEYSKNSRLKTAFGKLVDLEMTNFFNLNNSWGNNFFTDGHLLINLLDNTKKNATNLYKLLIL